MSGSAETFKLNVLILGETEVVSVSRNWCIFDLKEVIGCRKGIEPKYLHVIFAGAEVGDDFCFRTCDVSQGSVLHVLVTEEPSETPDSLTSVSSLGPSAEGLEIQQRERHRARFYVYCKSVCGQVCVGKLRVRCKVCKDQGFRIDREPDAWEDVLSHEKITGSCIDENCRGKFTEFFFKCGNHKPLGDERDEAFPLSMVRTNVVDVPCLICTEVQPVVLVFSCLDSHTICLDCFSGYCRSLISSRQFMMVDSCDALAYTVVCPGNGENCNSSYVVEPHHFRIPGKDFYSRYQDYAAEDMVLQNNGVLCPGVNCGNGLFPARTQRKVTCDQRLGGCGLVFCRHCLLEYHDGSCTLADEAPAAVASRKIVSVSDAQNAQWDRSSRALIRQIAKRCPKCNMPIQKTGGCNHMTCASCHFHFCWLCLIQWNGRCQNEHWFLG